MVPWSAMLGLALLGVAAGAATGADTARSAATRRLGRAIFVAALAALAVSQVIVLRRTNADDSFGKLLAGIVLGAGLVLAIGRVPSRMIRRRRPRRQRSHHRAEQERVRRPSRQASYAVQTDSEQRAEELVAQQLLQRRLAAEYGDQLLRTEPDTDGSVCAILADGRMIRYLPRRQTTEH